MRIRTLVITMFALAAGVICLGAIQRQKLTKFDDADGAILRKAAYRSTHPLRRVVHDGDMLGAVQIPRLGLTVPFVEGAENESLDLGAGHVQHTAFPGHRGNAGIAAHRDTCFRPLRFIRPGDDIVITTPDGVYDYIVTGTQIVLPTDGQVLARTPGKNLTLVTCYPFFYSGHAPQRFIVHARERA